MWAEDWVAFYSPFGASRVAGIITTRPAARNDTLFNHFREPARYNEMGKVSGLKSRWSDPLAITMRRIRRPGVSVTQTEVDRFIGTAPRCPTERFSFKVPTQAVVTKMEQSDLVPNRRLSDA